MMNSISKDHIPLGRPNYNLYFPQLDGLRFICFFLVFMYHSFATSYPQVANNSVYKFTRHTLFTNGNLGVNFFFVLSGFLITYLLIVEKLKNGHIDIRAFYIRRMLRIWPLFFIVVVFGFFIFPYLKSLWGFSPAETAHITYYLAFLNNFDFINSGTPDALSLAVLWSVAIEEQFYIVWPLLLYFLPVKYYPGVFILMIVASLSFRWMNAGNDLVMEKHTISCISDMMVGGVFAWLCFFAPGFINKIAIQRKWVWVILYILVGVIFLFRKQVFDHYDVLKALDRLVISIVFAFVIMEQNFAKNSFYKMSDFKWVSKLGMYTYGLYCLHMIGIVVVATLLNRFQLNTSLWQVIGLEGVLSLGLTIILAIASYHLYEKHFLQLKNGFTRVKSN